MANFVQTFFVDSNAVQQASHILITSVDLFFKGKPSSVAGGVVVGICPVENDAPAISKQFRRLARRTYEEVNTSTDSNVATSFGFSRPVVVVPGQSFGIIVTTESDEYTLWNHKTADRIVGTNSPSPGLTGTRDGKFFQSSTTETRALADSSLKFRVNIAEFNATSTVVSLVNDGFEFLTMSGRTGVFTGGEKVFANTAPIAGTVAAAAGSLFLIGSGTDFTTLTERQDIVIRSNDTYQVNQIKYISNTSHVELKIPCGIANTAALVMPAVLGKVQTSNYPQETIVLSSSNATTARKFAPGQLLRGETSNTTATVSTINNVNADEFIVQLGVITNAEASTNLSYSFAYSNGSNYVVPAPVAITSGTKKDLKDQRNIILSRSNEVSELYLHQNMRSGLVSVSLSSTHRFAAPLVNLLNSDLLVHSYNISSNTFSTYANTVVYDTEVYKSGTGKARHIAEKMTFDDDRQAEDLRVFVSAWKPVGTELQVYAKLLNSADGESFDDKAWTPMVLSSNAGVRSSLSDKNDVVEYQYSIPAFPDSITTVNNSFTSTLSSTTLTSTGGTAPNTQVTTGQPVKVYSPLFPDNYMISSVASANTTAIVLSTIVANNNIVGLGMKVDVLRYGTTAFANKENDNTVRYFNNGGASFDKFSTVQMKVVLLSSQTNIVPVVDQVEVIGVSA